MTRAGLLAAAVAVGLLGCRSESHRAPPRPVEPPVAQASAIPDAPLNGTLHGVQFVLRDARYIVDRRVGYAHTDIKLSAAKSETPCGPTVPARAASVWLRLQGEPLTGAKEIRLAPGEESPWSVHYQVFEDERWFGVGEGSAVVSIRELGPDGRLSGGIAVCFSDDKKSCVSGSFDAQSCPTSLDQPVRGAVPAEATPPNFRLQMFDAGAAFDAGAVFDAGAARPPQGSAPPAPPRH
jgi:hypothetical protein